MSKMDDGGEADAEIVMVTADIEELLVAFLAQHGHVQNPVYRNVQWLWSTTAKGPVANIKIRTVANIVPLKAVPGRKV